MSSRTVKVWDLPMRVFHWGLVLSVTGCIVTIKMGGDWMDWHALCGYTVAGLLAFRLIWGVVGSRYARFSSFIFSPKAIWRYMRGASHKHHIGHNPMGSLSVFAMLGALSFQAFGGLFASDDIAFEGPLARFIASDWVSMITGLHKSNQWLIYSLITMHLGAVLFYTLFKREGLIGAMLHGHKVVAEESSFLG